MIDTGCQCQMPQAVVPARHRPPAPPYSSDPSSSMGDPQTLQLPRRKEGKEESKQKQGTLIWPQVGSLDTQLAAMAGQDEAASAAQEVLRSQLAAARAEAAAVEERLAAARAAHESKSQECTRWAVMIHNESRFRRVGDGTRCAAASRSLLLCGAQDSHCAAEHTVS